ncbi:MAG: hypothetical protein A4E37_00034 [Methanoregulaceae archaeon PtaB.Bin056]|nr:MAG: hypothetical protein A4E37_00034 [Methanoregulaceae archaeon PtaB.Bin056]
MSLIDQCNEIPREETRREAVWLVSRMMRYRVDIMSGLEDEVHGLMEEMRSRGSRRRVRRIARRIALLTARIDQLAQDSRYDAIHLRGILNAGFAGLHEGRESPQDDAVRYIT